MTTPWTVTNIVAATDLSSASVPALRYARVFADAFSAKMTIVYSDRVVYPIDPVGPSQAMFLMPSPEHQGRLRAELIEQAEPIMSGRQYGIEVTAGQPIPAILETATAKNADLIVTGTHLREGWKRALLGSVSNGVLHGSRCPVLTVGREASDAVVRVTNILCPINFSDVAREALAVAARLATMFRSRLFIAHVIESGEVKGTVDDEERVRRWIGPELQAACSYREIVLRGGAAERLLDCVEDIGANLLVIGAQHKRSRDTTVIGATTERLIRFASCPVLVVPRKAVRPELEEQRTTAVAADG